MTKRKHIPPKPFQLSGKAAAQLSNYLAQIRKGITNVCELHTHDSAPSLGQTEFEELFIERILARTVTAVSASIRSITEALTTQKEAEAQALKTAAQNTAITPQGTNKEEDTLS